MSVAVDCGHEVVVDDNDDDDDDDGDKGGVGGKPPAKLPGVSYTNIGY